MGRKSTRENKNEYQRLRESVGLTIDDAIDRLGGCGISKSALNRVENGSKIPDPYMIVKMSEAYREPKLCNYYCSQVCEIGKEYVEKIEVRTLSQIVLETMVALNKVETKRHELMEIAQDGVISKSEIRDFVKIQLDLEKISNTTAALQYWVREMLAEGKIDCEEYQRIFEEINPSAAKDKKKKRKAGYEPMS